MKKNQFQFKSVPVGYGRFVMMAVPFTSSKRKLPKIKVSRAYKTADTPHFCAFVNGVVTTGDAYLNQPSATPPVNPYVTDTVLKTKSTALLNLFSGKQSKPATATAAQETVAKDALMPLVDGLANQCETICNQISAAAGNVAAGIAWLTHVGFLPAGKGHAKAHTLRQRHSGKGTCLAQFPFVGKGVIYVARVALTAENVVPVSWSNNIPVHVTGLLVGGGGIKTSNIVALQLGYVINTNANAHEIIDSEVTGKAIAPISTKSSKKKHQIPEYIYGTDPVIWMPTILYMVVQ
jgi:hypothetical protein